MVKRKELKEALIHGFKERIDDDLLPHVRKVKLLRDDILPDDVNKFWKAEPGELFIIVLESKRGIPDQHFLINGSLVVDGKDIDKAEEQVDEFEDAAFELFKEQLSFVHPVTGQQFEVHADSDNNIIDGEYVDVNEKQLVYRISFNVVGS